MKRYPLFTIAVIIALLVGLLIGSGMLPAFSETAPTQPVQGKGQIIVFCENISVPNGSSGATNVRSDMIRLSTYKNLSFMVGYSPGADEWPVQIDWTQEGCIPGLELGFVFSDGASKPVESSINLPVGFWGVPVAAPGAQISVPAPYGRVEISNTTGVDLTMTVKAYATE